MYRKHNLTYNTTLRNIEVYTVVYIYSRDRGMSGRLGLVSYTGDSEISDEEEIEHESTGHTPPAVVIQGLGIPSSRAKLVSTTPPSFVPPVVQSAPLVAYDDDMNESRVDDSVFTPQPENQEDGTNNTAISGTLSLEAAEESSKSETEFDPDTQNTLFLPLNNAHMPPEPPGKCSKALQDKVIALLQKEQRLGLDLNQHLQGLKDFRNPSIYEKLVTALDLDDFGTNFPEHLYNPKSWGEESNYKNLLEAQKKAYEKKEKAKLQDRTKIEFVKGTKRPIATASIGGAGGEAVKKTRRSKWDVNTGGAGDSSGGGSKGNTPNKLGDIGAQARAQATQLSKEMSKLTK